MGSYPVKGLARKQHINENNISLTSKTKFLSSVIFSLKILFPFLLFCAPWLSNIQLQENWGVGSFHETNTVLLLKTSNPETLMCIRSPEQLDKAQLGVPPLRFDLAGIVWSPKICISYNSPGIADAAADVRTVLGEVLWTSPSCNKSIWGKPGQAGLPKR